jgi:hypothetical protein
MNEYKLPTKKIWQLGSQDVELIKPIVSVGSPTSAPTVIGAMWICTEGPIIYISTGTQSVTDWRLIWD